MPKLKRTKAYFQLADRLIVERAKEHGPHCFHRTVVFRAITLGSDKCDCGTTQAREIVPMSEWNRPDTGPR